MYARAVARLRWICKIRWIKSNQSFRMHTSQSRREKTPPPQWAMRGTRLAERMRTRTKTSMMTTIATNPIVRICDDFGSARSIRNRGFGGENRSPSPRSSRMPRAIGRHAEVLLRRSGVNSVIRGLKVAGFIRHSTRPFTTRSSSYRIATECPAGVRRIIFRSSQSEDSTHVIGHGWPLAMTEKHDRHSVFGANGISQQQASHSKPSPLSPRSSTVAKRD